MCCSVLHPSRSIILDFLTLSTLLFLKFLRPTRQVSLYSFFTSFLCLRDHDSTHFLTFFNPRYIKICRIAWHLSFKFIKIVIPLLQRDKSYSALSTKSRDSSLNLDNLREALYIVFAILNYLINQRVHRPQKRKQNKFSSKSQVTDLKYLLLNQIVEMIRSRQIKTSIKILTDLGL